MKVKISVQQIMEADMLLNDIRVGNETNRYKYTESEIVHLLRLINTDMTNLDF